MAELTLDVARNILDTALAKGVEKKLKPLVVAVLDARGCNHPALALSPAASMPATAQASSLSEVSPLIPTAPSRTPPS